MWWVKDWVCIMQEELTGCLGVVFSVLVAVAREGPTTRRGRSICSMALPGGSARSTLGPWEAQCAKSFE
jgi:hypothetical protein